MNKNGINKKLNYCHIYPKRLFIDSVVLTSHFPADSHEQKKIEKNTKHNFSEAGKKVASGMEKGKRGKKSLVSGFQYQLPSFPWFPWDNIAFS